MRGYVRAITPRGVLALRGLVSSDFTDSGSPTPFYLQQYLGGGDTMRGMKSYRFQDQALFVLTAEYRWRVHRYIEVAPFVDAGSTAPALSRLTFNALKISPGIAIRARTDRRTIARLELASGPEGYRIIVGTGPSF
jgi:outer membrane protein assembly factor BamA